jgi:hypothetical protein
MVFLNIHITGHIAAVQNGLYNAWANIDWNGYMLAVDTRFLQQQHYCLSAAVGPCTISGIFFQQWGY